MIFLTGELCVLTALFLHLNPGHNVKTMLIKTIVKVKDVGMPTEIFCLYSLHGKPSWHETADVIDDVIDVLQKINDICAILNLNDLT